MTFQLLVKSVGNFQVYPHLDPDLLARYCTDRLQDTRHHARTNSASSALADHLERSMCLLPSLASLHVFLPNVNRPFTVIFLWDWYLQKHDDGCCIALFALH